MVMDKQIVKNYEAITSAIDILVSHKLATRIEMIEASLLSATGPIAHMNRAAEVYNKLFRFMKPGIDEESMAACNTIMNLILFNYDGAYRRGFEMTCDQLRMGYYDAPVIRKGGR